MLCVSGVAHKLSLGAKITFFIFLNNVISPVPSAAGPHKTLGVCHLGSPLSLTHSLGNLCLFSQKKNQAGKPNDSPKVPSKGQGKGGLGFLDFQPCANLAKAVC